VEDTAVVRKGEELFRLDPEPFQFALNANAAELKLAEIRLRDMRTLVERDAAAAARLDQLEAERDLAQAQFDQATYDIPEQHISASQGAAWCQHEQTNSHYFTILPTRLIT